MTPKQLEELGLTKHSPWQHHRGNRYILRYVANHANPSDKFPLTAVYEDINGNVWARPVDEFLKKFKRVW